MGDILGVWHYGIQERASKGKISAKTRQASGSSAKGKKGTDLFVSENQIENSASFAVAHFEEVKFDTCWKTQVSNLTPIYKPGTVFAVRKTKTEPGAQ